MDQATLTSLSNNHPAGTKTHPGAPGTTSWQDQDHEVARDHHQDGGETMRALGPGRVQLQQDPLDPGHARDQGHEPDPEVLDDKQGLGGVQLQQDTLPGEGHDEEEEMVVDIQDQGRVQLQQDHPDETQRRTQERVQLQKRLHQVRTKEQVENT